MIYDSVDSSAPIRQGDIFHALPRVEVSLQTISVMDADGRTSAVLWREVALSGHAVTALLPLRPVTGIVATQDCDALRSNDITLCEVRRFRDVEGKAAKTFAPRSWTSILTQQARINQKWFYLPPSDGMGFADKMAVDFTVTLRVPRVDLEILRDLRRGRLNDLAYAHFRERIAEFFRRYPYDEWYALDREEFACYVKEHPETAPFPWQESRDTLPRD